MAACAGEVDVPCALACVVVVADAIFLRSATVVDIVQQMCLAEEGQSAEQGGAVDGRQSLLEVAEAKNTFCLVANLFPNHCAHGCYADAGIGKGFFVGHFN